MALIGDDASPEKLKAAQKHKNMLESLRVAFEAESDRITKLTKKKIASLPESATDQRNAVLEEQQKALDKILAELSVAISRANHEFLETLEKLEKKGDEKELQSLFN